MVLIMMGVSGSGKSTLGRLLVERAGGVFLDADDFHPPENVAKMARGEALDDGDRAGWLEALAGEIARAESGLLVLACSALKTSYRRQLEVPGKDVRFVYLKGDEATLRARMEKRSAEEGHFMPASLLRSQLATLEEPEGAFVLDIRERPEELVTRLVRWLEA